MPINQLSAAQLALNQSEAVPDPIDQFRQWFEAAASTDAKHPEAMTLATATPDGRPSARIVLLRGFDHRGFVFFTNYQSRKAGELADNSRAALVFYWSAFDRQVRVEGRIEFVSPEESDAYFRTRPYCHQIGAWASAQSQVIPDRGVLEARVRQLEAEFGESVPRPLHWGGYRLVPTSIEFWQGRESRLHDRLLYTQQSNGSWRIERLAP